MQIWIAATLLAFTAALWIPMSRDRGRLRACFGFLLLFTCATLFGLWRPSAAAHDVAFAFLTLAGIQIAAVGIFPLAKRASIPRFASEILIVASYVSIVFNLLYREGVNVTGIFATSAVATAVIGLALQDMLSNIAGGIALELEDGIRKGDFVRCGEYSGWVRHIRLRHTAIRTPDGDTVFLPNSQLTRSPVHVSSRRHRLFVPFVMSYATNPNDLMRAVEFALRASPMAGILTDPVPECVIQEMATGHIRYAATVWTDQPGDTSRLTSIVLLRLYFALRRAGIAPSEITHVLEMKTGQAPVATALDPMDVLRRTPILRLLDDRDLFELAAHLRHLSFAPGEHIIRQGEAGASMYFIVAGEVAIALAGADGSERTVSSMGPGDFFGESSLLTGEPRNASSIARTQVDCYRLDKEALYNLMSQRVELAEDMSVVMVHRLMELTAAREQLNMETALRREAESQTQLLARIRKFFGLTANGARA